MFRARNAASSPASSAASTPPAAESSGSQVSIRNAVVMAVLLSAAAAGQGRQRARSVAEPTTERVREMGGRGRVLDDPPGGQDEQSPQGVALHGSSRAVSWPAAGARQMVRYSRAPASRRFGYG